MIQLQYVEFSFKEAIMIFLIILAVLLGNPISLLLFLSAMDDFSRADEVERMERQAERRHREMLKEQKKKAILLQLKKLLKRKCKGENTNERLLLYSKRIFALCSSG